jgi:four helix bundle protein
MRTTRHDWCNSLRVPPRDLKERTQRLALAVTRFLRALPKTNEAQEAAKQLRRAANSTRSNYRASKKGRTRKEFEAKLGIACEEADESVDWLEYLRDAGIADDPALIRESREIASILTAAVKTAKRNSSRTKILPKS